MGSERARGKLAPPAPEEQPSGVPTWFQTILEDVVRRAQLGDEKAMPRVHQTAVLPFDARGIEGAAERAQFALARALAGLDPVVQRSVEVRTAARRQELLAEGSSALERLLIERVLTCELAASLADLQVDEDAGVSLAQGDFLQRRQDAAHRRLLTACRTLAQVRHLRLPAVQLNVADRQVNIMQPAPHHGATIDG